MVALRRAAHLCRIPRQHRAVPAGGEVVFSDLSLNDPDSWEWVFEGGDPATSGEQAPVVTYNDPGVYDVTLTVSNSAGSNSLTKTGYITVDEVSSVLNPGADKFKVFPNPASGMLNIECASTVNAVGIHGLDGKEMLLRTPASNAFSLPLDGLAEGIYILVLKTDHQVVRTKLLITK